MCVVPLLHISNEEIVQRPSSLPSTTHSLDAHTPPLRRRRARSFISHFMQTNKMGLLFLVASYAIFFHVGRLLMCLVVVQPVSDGSVVRWCFASAFSFSLTLFNAVLADMAHVSLSASPQSTASTALQRLQHLVQVDAREFTVVLMCLLSTVLLACPGVVTLSSLRHVFCRRGVRVKKGQSASSGRRSRRSSSTASGRDRSGSRRSSNDFAFDSDHRRQRRGCWCGLRRTLVLLLLLLLLAGAGWAAYTRRVEFRRVGGRVVGVARSVYGQLHTRTALFQVPQEIHSRHPGESVVSPHDGEEGQEGGTITPPLPTAAAGVQREAGGGAWGFGFLSSPAAATTAGAAFSTEVLDVVRAITSRVAVVGVAMIGLLSGYAAVTTPCLFLAPYTYWRGREDELRRAQNNFTKKLCYIMGNHGNAQRQIAALQYGVLHEEWASPAFAASAPTTTTHSVPPSFDTAPSHGQAVGAYGAADALDPSAAPFHPPPQQFMESSLEGMPRNYPPPPPRAAGSGRSSDATNLLSPSSITKPPVPARGPVSWLQRTLTSAATVVTGGAGGHSLDSPATPGSAIVSAAATRQRAVARIRKLRDECRGSRFLSLSLYLQLNEVEGMLRDAQRGGTWVGRWYAGLGVAMALYSLAKAALTAGGLWFFRASTQDPVTRAVTLLENAFILRRRDGVSSPSFSVTAVEVSTHVILALALVVNGWMVLSSIRGALLALFHVTMSFSGSAISRPETVAVGLSMLIGVYFVGQLVLLRSSLPEWSRASADVVASAPGTVTPGANVLLQVLGTLPYYYYQRLNDWCFLVGCLGAVLVRRFVLRDVLSAVVLTASGGEER